MITTRRLERAITQYEDDHRCPEPCAPCIELGTAMFCSELWREQEHNWVLILRQLSCHPDFEQSVRMALKFALTVGINLEKTNDQQ